MIIYLIVCLFVYWFVCFVVFIILGDPQEVYFKRSSRSDMIWLRYLWSKNVYLLVSLFFVNGFVCNLLFSSWDIQRKFSWTFCEDLAWFGWDIYDLKCLFVCSSSCLFFILIIMGHQQEVSLTISWRFNLIWLRYLGSRKIFIYLLVCLYICLFFLF